MAENEDGQEKTEQPTAKRQRDAREKGQIPRSRELNTTAAMLVAAAGLMLFGGWMGEGLTGLFDWSFTVSRERIFDPGTPVRMLHQALGQGLLVVAPFALLMVLVAIAAPLLLGGWSFSGKALMPKFDKLDPIKGMKRIFGVRGLMELVKSLLKVMLVGVVASLVLWSYRDDLRVIADAPLESGIAQAVSLFFWLFFALAASLILVAAIDVPFQLFEHNKQLKMTKQEIKDEFKETEGKPEVKGRIRQMQRELSQGRMMESVPTADVIVTNPTHFAVALKYDQLNMDAPRLVAKGTDLVASRIRELARENNIPVFEAPPLARALYYTTEVDKEIPAGLYLAVAQVLAYIYQLRTPDPDNRPQRPKPEVPPEFEKYVKRGGPL